MFFETITPFLSYTNGGQSTVANDEKEKTSNSFIKIETHFMDIPCGPSMMDYPEVFINKTIENFFCTNKKFGNLPETSVAAFPKFP